jgi:hypothetical protein
MNRDDIDKLPAADNYIPGIYNYCDRWCKRCPQTLRCLNYALTEEHFRPDAETCDLANEIFWQKLAEMLKLTLDMVRDMAREMGIDLDEMINGPAGDALGPAPAGNVVHLIAHLAKNYADRVDGWFQRDIHGLVTPPSGPQPRLPGTADRKNEVDVQDAIEIIGWYQHLIYVKLCRAFDSASEEFADSTGEFLRDADGSAKVALISIDRSISAWGVLMERFSERQTEILQLVHILENLRKRVEAEFPQARHFVRPGFDNGLPP